MSDDPKWTAAEVSQLAGKIRERVNLAEAMAEFVEARKVDDVARTIKAIEPLLAWIPEAVEELRRLRIALSAHKASPADPCMLHEDCSRCAGHADLCMRGDGTVILVRRSSEVQPTSQTILNTLKGDGDERTGVDAARDLAGVRHVQGDGRDDREGHGVAGGVHPVQERQSERGGESAGPTSTGREERSGVSAPRTGEAPSNEDLDDLQRRHAATKGDWHMCGPCTTNPRGCSLVWTSANPEVPLIGKGDEGEFCVSNADAIFIAAAHQRVPAMIAELRKRRSEADSIQDHAGAFLPSAKRLSSRPTSPGRQGSPDLAAPYFAPEFLFVPNAKYDGGTVIARLREWGAGHASPRCTCAVREPLDDVHEIGCPSAARTDDTIPTGEASDANGPCLECNYGYMGHRANCSQRRESGSRSAEAKPDPFGDEDPGAQCTLPGDDVCGCCGRWRDAREKRRESPKPGLRVTPIAQVRAEAEESARNAGDAEDRCDEHGLTEAAHCAEMERMLEQLPEQFCEGEGDLPHEGVKRLADAYQEAMRDNVSDGRMVQVLQAHDQAGLSSWPDSDREKARRFDGLGVVMPANTLELIEEVRRETIEACVAALKSDPDRRHGEVAAAGEWLRIKMAAPFTRSTDGSKP